MSHSVQLGTIIKFQTIRPVGGGMHRRAVGVQACIFLAVGDGGEQSCVRSPHPPPPERTIDSASLPRAQADPHFVPLLFKRWCFLLSCDQAVVGLEEHQRKARGGGRRLGVFERGSDTLPAWITAASQGTRPAPGSGISPLFQHRSF